MALNANASGFIVVLIAYYILLTKLGSVGDQEALKILLKERAVKPKDIVFIVLSQSNSYHEKRNELFKKHFTEQIQHLKEGERPLLFFLHKQWSHTGAYTLFPLIEGFAANFSDKAWMFFCEEETRIKLSELVTFLSGFDYHEEIFMGKLLKDHERSIIHHYYSYTENPSRLLYPDPAAGIAMTLKLIISLDKRLKTYKPEIDFVIDPKHELAKYIHDNGNGKPLVAVSEFCTSVKENTCITSLPIRFPDCGNPIPVDDLFVAVKTCEAYHKERVPYVQKTFGKETKNIEYYSDKEDPSIPTVNLGIENTKTGHCGKTFAILERFVKEKTQPWLLICDDDTIISLKRLRKLLACYNPEEVVNLGERYGYSVVNLEYDAGYNYITGGGGMVFSRPAAQMIISKCNCPNIASPDDMIIGMCLRNHEIELVHTPYMHQARIKDYCPDFLAYRDHISFHKHYDIDPIQVYKMLDEADLKLKIKHDEF